LNPCYRRERGLATSRLPVISDPYPCIRGKENHEFAPGGIQGGIQKKRPPDGGTPGGKTEIEIDGLIFRIPAEYGQGEMRLLVQLQNNLNLIQLLQGQNAVIVDEMRRLRKGGAS